MLYNQMRKPLIRQHPLGVIFLIMSNQKNTATRVKNSTSVAQRRNLNLAAEDLNLLRFAKENQGSILQRIKKYLSLQCNIIVRKFLHQFLNRIFSKYSTLDLGRPEGLYRSYDSVATPSRGFLVLNKFNFK